MIFDKGQPETDQKGKGIEDGSMDDERGSQKSKKAPNSGSESQRNVGIKSRINFNMKALAEGIADSVISKLEKRQSGSTTEIMRNGEVSLILRRLAE